MLPSLECIIAAKVYQSLSYRLSFPSLGIMTFSETPVLQNFLPVYRENGSFFDNSSIMEVLPIYWNDERFSVPLFNKISSFSVGIMDIFDVPLSFRVFVAPYSDIACFLVSLCYRKLSLSTEIILDFCTSFLKLTHT